MALVGELGQYTDLSIDCLSNPEIFDEDVISQSIISILSTNFGERVKLSQFGSILPVQVFENISSVGGESLVSAILDSIRTWEDRISIIDSRVEFIARPNENSLEIIIPYIINSTGEIVVFNKVVTI